MKLDFCIPQNPRGKRVSLFPIKGVPDYRIVLNIPQEAFYLSINQLENGEEFGDLSDRQEINYYDSNEKYIGNEFFSGIVATFKFTAKLEEIFIKQC